MHLPSFLHLLNLSTRGIKAGKPAGPPIKGRSTVPTVASIKELGVASNPSISNLWRDNGGGGNIWGTNFIVFADTAVTYAANGLLAWFVSNSIVVMNPDPTVLTDFVQEDGYPKEFVARMSNESDTQLYAIWPNANIVPLTTPNYGISVYPVVRRDYSVGGGGVALYNTLVKINVAAKPPVATRLVPQLFYDTELQYGSFGLVRGYDGYIYMFGAVSYSPEGAGGIKVCRVTEGNVADRTQYRYWNGWYWSPKMPSVKDKSSNMLTYNGPYALGPASGDIYYNTYCKCWVAIFFDAFVDGIFRIMYTTGNSLIGTWSQPKDLYVTEPPAGSFNYAGHAYPGIDNGKTLLLSWTWGGNTTKMARVTFG